MQTSVTSVISEPGDKLTKNSKPGYVDTSPGACTYDTVAPQPTVVFLFEMGALTWIALFRPNNADLVDYVAMFGEHGAYEGSIIVILKFAWISATLLSGG